LVAPGGTSSAAFLCIQVGSLEPSVLSAVFGDAFIPRNINDVRCPVVNLNLLLAFSIALIGSTDYNFVNQTVQHFCVQLLGVGILADIFEELL